MQTLASSSAGWGSCVSAIYVGDVAWVSGTQFWPSIDLPVGGIWKTNSLLVSLSHSFSLSLSFSLPLSLFHTLSFINKFLKIWRVLWVDIWHISHYRVPVFKSLFHYRFTLGSSSDGSSDWVLPTHVGGCWLLTFVWPILCHRGCLRSEFMGEISLCLLSEWIISTHKYFKIRWRRFT